MRKIATVLSCLLLAGCWQSTGSLFHDVKPVQPFHAGKVVSSNPDKPGEVSHAVLTRAKDGSYRLASTGKKDVGDAVVLRFIALPGLPKDVFVFEAVSDDKCRAGQTCHPMTAKSERDYGLVRRTPRGAEVTNPDCNKSDAVARLPGVTAGDYSICSFESRASLERALSALAKQPWKTSVVYTYE
ncbi:MAG TPA: hypothetical protein VIG39_12505 [Rhizomicrobium sp.]